MKSQIQGRHTQQRRNRIRDERQNTSACTECVSLSEWGALRWIIHCVFKSLIKLHIHTHGLFTLIAQPTIEPHSAPSIEQLTEKNKREEEFLLSDGSQLGCGALQMTTAVRLTFYSLTSYIFSWISPSFYWMQITFYLSTSLHKHNF